MNVVQRRRRRSDRWASPHERARTRAAERLSEPLDPTEADWLEHHLAECPACLSVAESYAVQQAALRALRNGPTPEPPRDLWARTAAAIEREAGRSDDRRRRRFRLSSVSLGLVSGAVVVAVVAAVSLLPRNSPIVVPSDDVARASTPPPVPLVTAAPEPTPWQVEAGPVAFLRQDENGRFGYVIADVSEVCPPHDRAACAPLDEVRRRELPLLDAPRAVVLSPKSDQLVVVEESEGGQGGTVIAVAVPTPESGGVGGPSASPSGFLPPDSPSPSVAGSPPPPSVLPSPSPSPPPSPAPTSSGAASPVPPTSPSVGPSGSLAPSGSAGPSGDPTPTTAPSGSPNPTADGAAIARDVILVGNSAAYSSDGAWFAFSARPADGSHGPDIYLWRVGDEEARPITDDHRSVFAGWYGSSMLGSRVVEVVDEDGAADDEGDGGSNGEGRDGGEPAVPAGSPAPGAPDPSGTPQADPSGRSAFRPQSFLIDPVTLEERPLDDPRLWFPLVDPSGTWAVYWDGTLELYETDMTWRPAIGRLVLGRWTEPIPVPPSAGEGTADSEGAASGDGDLDERSGELAVGAPRPSATPVSVGAASASPSPSASPDSTATSASPSPDATEPAVVLHAGRLSEWDVQWGPDGTHLAVWIADAAESSIGRLSLYELGSGEDDAALEPLISGVPALSGFSIRDGRLAWATPRGQDGQRSRVQVIAWTTDGVGQVETVPGDEVIVIR